ncbi:fumarylacetoacetate hydrolase family protein [Williamwhitmania taraxaci]|uniref:2-keto-4-pentenoate hydratase/2-oxohepta-3-ene-1,7-dioic acid hydratase (Catechol pathway) n=1 Tax=Williamwhitmania taraxaci TaxID=1640674 RepID=A0A1G6LL47_9BACT|nr:fumarylacetoacetate hydrolase family protein [Williamwhitmania taraxaci]SDC43834.1 2-keto-4-pentenoate hydratase/2-oxohepta-3-ene-1,7-dioic acid hydratase (catechol pathway) [Williamwhitmania taraxaci]
MKIICIGRNYAEHAKELENQVPESPVFFLKPDTAQLRHNQPFYIPDFSKEIHFEVELVYKINRLGKHIAERFASRYTSEVGIGIDFTARDLQRECKAKGLPWECAKSFDYSAPVSMEFVPLDQLPDPNAIHFRLEKNGIVVQSGCSSDMIFSVDKLIAHVSIFLSLKMGDLLFTGTPAGVGPVQAGDRLQAYIEDRLMLDFFIK